MLLHVWMKGGRLLHSWCNSVHITKQSIFVALWSPAKTWCIRSDSRQCVPARLWDTTLVGAKPCGKGMCRGLISECRTSDNFFFFRDAPIFNLYITFYYRKYQSREDQATQGNAYIHNWNGAGAAVSNMDSTKQQLRKNMTNKFPFLMANNTLQACLFRLGMPRDKFQNCTVQAFCLAWQRTGRRAHGWFALTTFPNTSRNISCRAKFLTSNNGVLPE